MSYILRITKEDPDEETFTVIFHAILSDKFKMDDGQSCIVIRGEKPVFGGWDHGGEPVTIR